jgi:hypothetical protein
VRCGDKLNEKDNVYMANRNGQLIIWMFTGFPWNVAPDSKAILSEKIWRKRAKILLKYF